MESERVTHDALPPIFDAGSLVLILGTMPSPRSRQTACYYGHPQNRFWPTLAALYGEDTGTAAAEREAFAHRHHIALWDVLYACTIRGAADATIADAVPNDIRPLLAACPIEGIFVTGRTAAKLYDRYLLPLTGRPALCLPSTSPANRRVSDGELLAAFRAVREITG